MGDRREDEILLWHTFSGESIYRGQVKYVLDSNDNVYYAMSDRYEIKVMSSERKIIKKITKKGKSKKIIALKRIKGKIVIGYSATVS